MKTTMMIVIALSFTLFTHAQIKDVNGNKYKTTKIGNQKWMAENLTASSFSNGDKIPQARSLNEWIAYADQSSPTWAYYDFDSVDLKGTGKLYNYYAVADKRGLAPKGWTVPSLEDWKTLTSFVGGDSIAGKKLKSKEGWVRQWLVAEDSSITNPNGLNSYGFNAKPTGSIYSEGAEDGDEYGEWWSMTPFESLDDECLHDVSLWYSYEYGYDGIIFGFGGGKKCMNKY